MRNPEELPWGDVDIALECTGIFTDKEKAAIHLENGSKRVLVSAPVGRRRQDHRLRRQRQGADQGRPRRLQRLLHDQLPLAGRLCARQGDRDREGLHDHDPQLHRRPADARHDAQGPLPRPRRGALDDPDLDRRRQGGRPRAAASSTASSTASRSACRPRTSRSSTSSSSPRSATTVDEINAAIKAAAEGELKGILGYTDEPLVSSRLQPRHAFLGLPHGPDQGDGRHLRSAS